MENKDKLIVWLKSHTLIQPTRIETALGIPKRSIILNKGFISSKHIKRIEEYLYSYGYDKPYVDTVQDKQPLPIEETIEPLQNGLGIELGLDYRIQKRGTANLWSTENQYKTAVLYR